MQTEALNAKTKSDIKKDDETNSDNKEDDKIEDVMTKTEI